MVGTGRAGAGSLFHFRFVSVATNNGFDYLLICNGASLVAVGRTESHTSCDERTGA